MIAHPGQYDDRVAAIDDGTNVIRRSKRTTYVIKKFAEVVRKTNKEMEELRVAMITLENERKVNLKTEGKKPFRKKLDRNLLRGAFRGRELKKEMHRNQRR